MLYNMVFNRITHHHLIFGPPQQTLASALLPQEKNMMQNMLC